MLHAPCFKGFSIVEVMLAVFLVSVGVMASLALISSGIKHSTESRRQLIATMLSQEGIELVRNIRDTNAKNGLDSFDEIDNGDHTMDYSDTKLQSNSGNNKYLQYLNGFYKRGGSASTSQFSRIIKITGSGDQRTVYSTVVWENGNIPTVPSSESNCNLIKKCAFTKITLNKWRE